MKLEPKDAQLFFELWLPLVDYANKKYKVNPKLNNMLAEKSLNPSDVYQVAKVIWEDVSILDEYLEKHANLPEEHQEIIRGWKRRVHGDFLLERNLKKGSIFISMEDNAVYLVKGITDSWETLLRGRKPPLFLRANLIPFRDVIITDGLVSPYSVMLGSGMKGSFKDVYLNAKAEGRIHHSL